MNNLRVSEISNAVKIKGLPKRTSFKYKSESRVFQNTMKPKTHLFCVIPSLNEEEGIGGVIQSIQKDLQEYDFNVIVVDGYSKDKTREIATRLGAMVILESGEKSQRGYGNALYSGFQLVVHKLSTSDDDIIIMLDADGTYLPRDIPLLVEYLLKTNSGQVIGNRFANLKPGAMNFRNRFGNKVISVLLNLLYNSHIKDSQCGMRALRVSAIKKMRLMQNGMPFATELIMESKKKNIVISQVPISYELRKGEAKLSPIRDGMKILISMAEHFTGYRPQKLFNLLNNLVLEIIKPFDYIMKLIFKLKS